MDGVACCVLALGCQKAIQLSAVQKIWKDSLCPHCQCHTGVIVPIPSALLPLIDGYVVTATPTIVCAGRNLDVTYYTFILPMSVTLGTTSCLLVLIVWTIFKVRKLGHRHTIHCAYLDLTPSPLYGRTNLGREQPSVQALLLILLVMYRAKLKYQSMVC